jgi:hypothetical protein
MTTNTKHHQNNVYTTQQACEVSWTQAIPQTSLKFIANAQLHKINVPSNAFCNNSKLYIL